MPNARDDGSARTVNPWIIAVAVTIATFMEVLDTSIANVALRYIAGGLSAAESDSEWIITSYLAANAIILPISGWLATLRSAARELKNVLNLRRGGAKATRH